MLEFLFALFAYPTRTRNQQQARNYLDEDGENTRQDFLQRVIWLLLRRGLGEGRRQSIEVVHCAREVEMNNVVGDPGAWSCLYR